MGYCLGRFNLYSSQYTLSSTLYLLPATSRIHFNTLNKFYLIKILQIQSIVVTDCFDGFTSENAILIFNYFRVVTHVKTYLNFYQSNNVVVEITVSSFFSISFVFKCIV